MERTRRSPAPSTKPETAQASSALGPVVVQVCGRASSQTPGKMASAPTSAPSTDAPQPPCRVGLPWPIAQTIRPVPIDHPPSAASAYQPFPRIPATEPTTARPKTLERMPTQSWAVNGSDGSGGPGGGRDQCAKRSGSSSSSSCGSGTDRDRRRARAGSSGSVCWAAGAVGCGDVCRGEPGAGVGGSGVIGSVARAIAGAEMTTSPESNTTNVRDGVTS